MLPRYIHFIFVNLFIFYWISGKNLGFTDALDPKISAGVGGCFSFKLKPSNWRFVGTVKHCFVLEPKEVMKILTWGVNCGSVVCQGAVTRLRLFFLLVAQLKLCQRSESTGWKCRSALFSPGFLV